MSGLSAPRAIFGIYSVSPYSRADGTFYGIMKVLASSTLQITGQLIELFGGANQYSWGAEAGQIKADMDLKPKEFPDFLFTLFFGVTPTSVLTADTAGVVGTLINVKGTTAFSSTIGIATATITTIPSLPFTKFLVLVKSATTVDVYAGTDEDFGIKGAGLVYQNDALKITATALTIAMGGTVVIPNTGITLTGGSGTIGMTTGDTMVFTVQPTSARQMNVLVGSAKAVTPEFSALLMSQRRGTGELVELDVYRIRGIGFPIGMDEFKWAESSVKATVLYDSAKDAIFNIRYVQES